MQDSGTHDCTQNCLEKLAPLCCGGVGCSLWVNTPISLSKGVPPMAMDTTLILRTLTPIVETLEQLTIPYHIGGSVASSLYGEFRPTQDVDIVADMQLSQAQPFVKLLEGDYYVVEDSAR